MTNELSRVDERKMSEKYKPLINLINNEPLIEAKPTLDMLSFKAIDANPNGSIYYGTGLTTPKEIGVGLPFDVLGMILVAERIKRAVGLKNIYHHIADTHAKTNSWIDPNKVDERAKDVKETLEKVSGNLNIQGFNVVMSSDFDSSSEYQNLVKKFNSASNEHEYVIREMADMEWYREKYGTVIKMGWIIQSSDTALGFDERLFDREYSRIQGYKLAFIYTKPGRTMDKSRPKASPYIQVNGEQRILLKKGENVKDKISKARQLFGDPHLGGSMKHMESIVRDYEKLFGNLGRTPFEDKIQNIIDTVTK